MSNKVKMSMSSLALLALVALVGRVASKLVFPPGSDIGYIVPDAAAELEISEAMEPATDPQYNSLLQQLRINRRTAREERHQNAVDYEQLWLPHQLRDLVATPDNTNSAINSALLPSSLHDEKHGVVMGVANKYCDDAKSNLLMDWDYSPANYTCYTPRYSLPLSTDGEPSTLTCNTPPSDYMPQHYCMDTPITYSSAIPSHGDHRPLWPQFGEYKFVPVQRWLHSVEHGSIVMLYHPCARPALVDELRTLVTGCLYKHVITPYSPLSHRRPLALVAWGCVLEMATVDPQEVVSFIQQKALQGPEGKLRKQGLFTEGLVRPSIVPEGKLDDGLTLCT